MNILTQDASASLVTKPKNPLGPVVYCLCGRWNDSVRDRNCPDCHAPVRAMTGQPDPDALYRMQVQSAKDVALSFAARQSLGMFIVAEIEDDVRQAVGRR